MSFVISHLCSCLSLFFQFFCLSSVYTFISLSFCLSVFLSFCLSVFLSFCLSVFLSFCLSCTLYILSFCLYLNLSDICLPAFMSIFLFVCLSIFPSVLHVPVSVTVRLLNIRKLEKVENWKLKSSKLRN